MPVNNNMKRPWRLVGLPQKMQPVRSARYMGTLSECLHGVPAFRRPFGRCGKSNKARQLKEDKSVNTDEAGRKNA